MVQLQKSLTRNQSASVIKSRLQQIGRIQDEIVRIQKAKASISGRIATLTANLHREQQRLQKVEAAGQNQLLEAIKTMQDRERSIQDRTLKTIKSSLEGKQALIQKYDAFICHASEDKKEVVNPLAQELIKKGLKIWYDDFEITVGDSLRQSIDLGLAHSRFGIVVLSHNFFAKQWTQYELNGLFAKEMQGDKVILPLWHKITKDEIISYSPTLADRLALKTATNTVTELAAVLAETVMPAQ